MLGSLAAHIVASEYIFKGNAQFGGEKKEKSKNPKGLVQLIQRKKIGVCITKEAKSETSNTS